MRVLLLSETDCTGQNALLAKTMIEHLGWEARTITSVATYLDYPTDWVVSQNTEEDVLDMAEFAKTTDLFIFQDVLLDYDGLGLVELCHHKNTIISGQGTLMRANIQLLAEMALDGWHILPPLGYPEIASKLGGAPFENWMVDCDRILDLSRDIKKRDKITVCHAPTNQLLKGTKRWQEIVSKFDDVEFMLITGTPWEETIKKKAEAHILVDSLGEDHYGAGNCMEGLLQTQAVLSSISPWDYCLHPDLPILTTWYGLEEMILGNAINNWRTEPEKTEKRLGCQRRWVMRNFSPENQIRKWENYIKWVMLR